MPTVWVDGLAVAALYAGFRRLRPTPHPPERNGFGHPEEDA